MTEGEDLDRNRGTLLSSISRDMVICWIRRGIAFFLFMPVFFSCVTKEFEIEKYGYDDQWELKITVPLFTGEIMLADLADEFAMNSIPPDRNYAELQFSEDSSMYLPTEYLYSKGILFEDFHFTIADEYEIKEGEMIYIVSNGITLPVHMETEFYTGNYDGILFSPPNFLPAEYRAIGLVSITTKHQMTIPPESYGFVEKNRVRFEIWFEPPAEAPDSVIQLPAQSTLKVTMIFSGTVTEKLEEDAEGN